MSSIFIGYPPEGVFRKSSLTGTLAERFALALGVRCKELATRWYAVKSAASTLLHKFC